LRITRSHTKVDDYIKDNMKAWRRNRKMNGIEILFHPIGDNKKLVDSFYVGERLGAVSSNSTP
jgi:hypothetical protein